MFTMFRDEYVAFTLAKYSGLVLAGICNLHSLQSQVGEHLRVLPCCHLASASGEEAKCEFYVKSPVEERLLEGIIVVARLCSSPDDCLGNCNWVSKDWNCSAATS